MPAPTQRTYLPETLIVVPRKARLGFNPEHMHDLGTWLAVHINRAERGLDRSRRAYARNPTAAMSGMLVYWSNVISGYYKLLDALPETWANKEDATARKCLAAWRRRVEARLAGGPKLEAASECDYPQ